MALVAGCVRMVSGKCVSVCRSKRGASSVLRILFPNAGVHREMSDPRGKQLNPNVTMRNREAG